MPVGFTTSASFKDVFAAAKAPMAKAVGEAMRQAAGDMLSQGRRAITSSGLPAAWVTAFTVKAYPSSGGSLKAKLFANAYGAINVFEFGAHIKGKPLLWLPVSSLPKGTTPENCGVELHSVNRPGHPPMLAGGPPGHMVIMFIGLSAVDIKKKLDLVGVCENIARGLPVTISALYKPDK